MVSIRARLGSDRPARRPLGRVRPARTSDRARDACRVSIDPGRTAECSAAGTGASEMSARTSQRATRRPCCEAVPTDLYIGGQWRAASGRRHARGRGPGHRGAAPRGGRRPGRGCAGGAGSGGGETGRVGGDGAARARRDPAPRLRGDRRADRAAGAADDARDGQGARGVARGDRLRGRVLPLVLGGGRAHPRALHGQHDGQGPHPHDAPAGRPVRVRHPLELPHGDGHAQDRPGDRRRVHDRGQAGPADAAVDARAGEDPARRPGCREEC